MVDPVTERLSRRGRSRTRRRIITPIRIVLLFCLASPLLFAGTGSVLYWCPICGHGDGYSYTQLYGVKFKSGSDWAGPCLSGEHRRLETSWTFSPWWKDGYNHASSEAFGLKFQRAIMIEPWLEARDTDPVARERVIEALRTASVKQLLELLNRDEWDALSQEEILYWTEQVEAEKSQQ